MKLVRLQQMWRELNALHFEGKLTELPIKITRAKKYYGFFDDGTGKNGKSRLLPHICISGVRNDTQSEYHDTMLHEMIHQYLWETEQDMDLDHGPEWTALAVKLGVRINEHLDGDTRPACKAYP